MTTKLQLTLRRILLTATAVCLALALALLTACNDDNTQNTDDSDNTETASTVTDYQTLANGDFEFNTDGNVSFPYASSVKWTRTSDSKLSSAPSSSYSSGIIDTKAEAYDDLSSNHKPKDDEGKAVNPKTPYSEGLVQNDYDKEDSEKRSNVNAAGTKVLMIHNVQSSASGLGTAQKFKSTTNLTLGANEYGKLSLWVNTLNLTTKNFAKKESKDYGAYVSVSNAVNGQTFSSVLLDNINTDGTWAYYEIYFEGSEFASSTLSVTFGLGKGNASDTSNFVEGFAYFDNVHFEKIDKADWNVSGLTSYTAQVDGEEIVVDTKNTDYTVDYSAKSKLVVSNLTGIDGTDALALNVKRNDEVITSVYLPSLTGNKAETVSYSSLDAKYKTDKLALTTANLLEFTKASAGVMDSDEVLVKAESKKLFSFYANVAITNGASTGLNLKVEDVNAVGTNKNQPIFSSIITEGDEVLDGFVKYYVIIDNPTDADTYVKLHFVFGPTTYTDDALNLTAGYALVADLKSADVTEEQAGLMKASTTIANVTVYGEYSNYGDEGDGDDTASDIYGITEGVSQRGSIKVAPTPYITGYIVKGNEDGKAITGLVNSKYENEPAYQEIANIGELKNLNSNGNIYGQAAVIYNKESTAVGIMAGQSNFAANSYSVVVARVRAYGDAVANLYLTSENEVITINGSDWSKKLTTTANKDTALSKDGKWVEIKIYVATGNESKKYNIELWNGAKDGSQNVTGTLFVEDIYIDTLDYIQLTADMADYVELYAGTELALEEKSFTRVATVKYLDDNDEVKETTRTFESMTAYAANSTLLFADYTAIDADEVIDETDVKEEEPEEEEEEEGDNGGYQINNNVWLQFTSIVISVALILVVIVLLIKQIIGKRKTRGDKQKAYYSRDTRAEAMEKIAAKKAKMKAEAESKKAEEEAIEEETEETTEEEAMEEVVEEYDYEAAQQVVEDEPIDTEINIDDINKETLADDSVNEDTDASDGDNQDTPSDQQ